MTRAVTNEILGQSAYLIVGKNRRDVVALDATEQLAALVDDVGASSLFVDPTPGFWRWTGALECVCDEWRAVGRVQLVSENCLPGLFWTEMRR